MNNVAKTVRVVGPDNSFEGLGLQEQLLTPCITQETCGAEGISAGMVNMPPGGRSKAHYHAHSEIVVVCLRGRAATLAGPELTPYYHGPGEFIFIPEGVVHVAVNLSDTDNLVAVEMRTDPHFNDDVVLAPEYEPKVPAIIAGVRLLPAVGA